MRIYDDFNILAKEKINKYGGEILLHVPIDGEVNSSTGRITYNEITIPTKGVVTSYSSREVNDINILEGDKKVLISTEKGKPLVNNTVTVGSETYRIIEVHEVNPGVSTPIIYRLHVRSTELAPNLEGFFTTLKGLSVGDVVEDPKEPKDYPRWIKVANDHHEFGITTLVEERPFEFYRYDDGEPYLGRWSDSDMYSYLNEEHLAQMSLELNEILETVLVETNTIIIGSKITLPSEEELTGTPSSDGSSGKQIDYFNSNRRRVAVDQDTLLTINWWTRSHEANSEARIVDSVGKLYTETTSFNAYIRAMIFIKDLQIVKLNDDGETYSLVYDSPFI